jgi:hypothetical protein
MKLPKLLLSLVLLLGVGAGSAGAVSLSGLYAYGSGSGLAVIVGNGSEYHQVMADQWTPVSVYSPEFGINGMEMESYCGGASTSYSGQCTLYVNAGESATVYYHTFSAYNGTALLRIGSTYYYGNSDGTLILGPGVYDLQAYVSGNYSNDSADADIIVYPN